jgi:uncharacterized DUF497 family protein
MYYNVFMEPVAVVIRQLIWDDWNVGHISRHNVVPNEVEYSLADDCAVFLRAKHGRVMVLGKAGKKLITTVMNEQAVEGIFYMITARDMSKKERNFYRSMKENLDEEQSS